MVDHAHEHVWVEDERPVVELEAVWDRRKCSCGEVEVRPHLLAGSRQPTALHWDESAWWMALRREQLAIEYPAALA